MESRAIPQRDQPAPRGRFVSPGEMARAQFLAGMARTGAWCWTAVRRVAWWGWQAARYAVPWLWIAALFILRALRAVVWHLIFRPASTMKRGQNLARIARVTLVVAVALFVVYANFFSLRHTGEVLRAFGYLSQRTAVSLARFEWLWRRVDIDNSIREASARNGVHESLVRAVIKVESNFRPYAISPTGACGLMQIQPTTMAYLKGGNPFEPRENIAAGVRYLAQLQKEFKGRTDLALAAYNAGPGAVRNALRQHGGIPRNAETVEYVRRVMSIYRPPQPAIQPVASN